MNTIGIDVGSSSVKLALFNAETGICIASVQFPETEEMIIDSPQTGWAEQNPELWWDYVKKGIKYLLSVQGAKAENVTAIGIAYQMHGLVCVDKENRVLRPSIIWCDSRAVSIGNQAFEEIGKEKCLFHLLNSPGNFTAAKLAWVKQNEPEIFEQIHKIMLPGDFIALRLTGETTTTSSGLSEGIMWDFQHNSSANFLLNYFGFEASLLSSVVPQFGMQGQILASVAEELGLNKTVQITYRAGDQPNNAFSLQVLNPGEVAATAGTSGVVYGVTDQVKYDPLSRVNTFLHVNHEPLHPRLGVLLCINGTGILNSWLKKNLATGCSYPKMNELALSVNTGSDGLVVLPFGNGAERVLQNKVSDCQIHGLNFNRHTQAHVIRAAHEGIAFAFKYGMDIMKESGISLNVIRAGYANMFLSPVFGQTLSTITGTEIQLFNTDGALGAARGAAVGVGIYQSFSQAFENFKQLETVTPNPLDKTVLEQAYFKWKSILINKTK